MLSRDEIKAVYDQGPDAVIALVEGLIASFQQQIDQLQAQVKELQDRLALHSNNSSKPPSSNFPAQRTKSARTPSGQKPGAQPGHPGTTLKASPTPDEIVVHDTASCHGCGQSLNDVAGEELADQRQVFDLPPLKLRVTEHRLLKQICPSCQTLNCGAFPAGLAPGVQYGPNLKALATYLVQDHLLPWQRTSELLGDLFGQPIAEGTIWSSISQCAAGLVKPEAQIKAALTKAAVVNCDETGLYVAGQREWLHVAGTSQLTYYATHAKRGQVALEEMAILPHFDGRAIHDAWSPYFKYDCDHGLCNAHHLRELTFVHEQMKQAWGKDCKDLLRAIKQAVEQTRAQGANALPQARQREFEQDYDNVIAAGLQLPENQPPHQPASEVGSNKANQKTCWTACRKGNQRRWPLCTTSACRSITIRPNVTCAWSKSNKKSPAAFAQATEPKLSAVFAATSQPSKNKVVTYSQP